MFFPSHVGRVLAWFWRQWLIITVLWFACAVWVVVAVKHEKHKALLSVLGNGLFGTLIVAPFAVCGSPRSDSPPPETEIATSESQSQRPRFLSSIHTAMCLRVSLYPLRERLGIVLLISVLAGLERNLTNASLYTIGGSLKTALHGFNVFFVFLVSGLVPGVDKRTRIFLLGGQGLRKRCRPSNLALLPVLLLVVGGGSVTAVCGKQEKGAWQAGVVGVLLQLSSGVVYALKYALMKLLLGHQSQPQSGDHAWRQQRIVAPGETTGSLSASASPIPTKPQVALVAQPLTGLIALAFVLVFENGDFTPPPLDEVFYFALGGTGILIFELQLVQLTSPLTVAVLAAMHNVVIVLFFVLQDGESLDSAQSAGFAVSTVGVIGYAVVKHWQRTEDVREAEDGAEEPLGVQLGGDQDRSQFMGNESR